MSNAIATLGGAMDDCFAPSLQSSDSLMCCAEPAIHSDSIEACAKAGLGRFRLGN